MNRKFYLFFILILSLSFLATCYSQQDAGDIGSAILLSNITNITKNYYNVSNSTINNITIYNVTNITYYNSTKFQNITINQTLNWSNDYGRTLRILEDLHSKTDGYKIVYNTNFEAPFDDWIVHYKTDGNDPIPDGGIAFGMANTTKNWTTVWFYGDGNTKILNNITAKNFIGNWNGSVNYLKNTGDTGTGNYSFIGLTKLGSVSSYINFESDGTLHMTGNSTVYDDLQFVVSNAKVPATNAPNWEPFTSNTQEYAFSVGNYIDFGANEPFHSWKEGTTWDIHCHITPKSAQNTGANRYVKLNISVAYANWNNSVWIETYRLGELRIPTGTSALTNFYLDMGDITPTGYTIGTQIKLRIKRISATSGVEYSDVLFITQCGLHLIKDTLGSRSETTK